MGNRSWFTNICLSHIYPGSSPNLQKECETVESTCPGWKAKKRRQEVPDSRLPSYCLIGVDTQNHHSSSVCNSFVNFQTQMANLAQCCPWCFCRKISALRFVSPGTQKKSVRRLFFLHVFLSVPKFHATCSFVRFSSDSFLFPIQTFLPWLLCVPGVFVQTSVCGKLVAHHSSPHLNDPLSSLAQVLCTNNV